MFGFLKNPAVSKCKRVFEYIPLIVLLVIMVVAEEEMDRSLIRASWSAVFTFVILAFVYILLVVFKVRHKGIVLAIAIILWVILVYVKQCIL